MTAPSILPASVDVCVVGAGTAGAAAALFCARSGLSVLCIDRRALGDAGARWVNGVSRRLFRDVDLAEPEAPERRGGERPFHLVAGYDGPSLVVTGHDLLEVDMRHLVARLQTAARDAGATVAGGIDVLGHRDGVLATSAGEVRARFVVDASGLTGARLLPAPRVGRSHLCSAAQEVRGCDRDGARAYFSARGVGEGETLCFTSVAGGFSVVNVCYHGDEVSILTGSIAEGSVPGGARLLRDFVASQPWIGARRFGGRRAIPLRRPFDRIARGPVAAIGDAAAQVFSAHGSGIAPGLLAARCLADQLAAGRGTEGYAREYQRTRGGLLAAYDVFRRFSQTLSVADLGRLIDSGLMNATTSRAGLEQRLPEPPSAREVIGYARSLVRDPRFAARLGRVLGRMLAVRALYERYPESDGGLERWGRAVARLVGDAPDSDGMVGSW